MSPALRRRTGVALWRQIADEIRAAMSTGLADVNGRLPSEHSLAERFGVNRHTVRAAIKALADEGAVETRHGDGTYVRLQARIVYPLGLRTRFTEGVGAQARSKRGKLLKPAIIETDAAVAKQLELDPTADLLRMDITSQADGIALTTSTVWFEAARFKGIEGAYEKHGSITKSLRDHGVEDYFRKSTRVEARHATLEEADRLGLADGAVVLLTSAINATPDGTPIQYSLTVFAADRVSLHIESNVS